MQRTIDECNRRREKQIRYNEEHSITPKTIYKSKDQIMRSGAVLDMKRVDPAAYVEPDEASLVADPVVEYMSKDQLQKAIQSSRKNMDPQ